MEGHLPICEVCGGSEYVKESGFFYCKECQTQSQDIRDQIVDNDAGSIVSIEREAFHTVKPRRKKMGRGSQIVNESDLTSWEMYNLVLIGQVNELLELGAPPEIKLTVFQLWSYYLKKLQVAFFSKRFPSLPKLGPGYKERDAQLIFGMKNLKKKKVNSSSRISTSVMSTSATSEWDEAQEKKRALRRSKRELMAQDSILQSEADDSTDFNASSALDQSSRLSESCISSAEDCDDRSYKVRYSTFAKDAFKRRRMAEKSIRNLRLYYTNPASVSKFKLIVLLYFALLYHGSTIQISDLLRWIRESHLAYFDVSPFLPLGHNFGVKDYNTFGPNQFMPSYSAFLKMANPLAQFLDLTDWHTPSVKALADKYVADLNLPELFGALVGRFVDLMPLTYLWREDGIPKYEIRIISILIIIMKLFFGLDGKTEYEISAVTSELNKLANNKKCSSDSSELFVWSDWMKYMECRNAVLADHHFPTKEVVFPDVYNPRLFIQYLKKWEADHPDSKERFKNFYINAVPSRILGVVRETLNKLSDLPIEDNSKIEFPPTLRPFSTYTDCILRAHSQHQSIHIAKAAKKVISKDFSTTDAHYLLEPQKCVELARKLNWHLRVKYASAYEDFVQVPEREAKQQKQTCKKKVVYLVKCWKNSRESRQRSKSAGKASKSRARKCEKHSKSEGERVLWWHSFDRSSENRRPKYIYSPCKQYWVWQGVLDDLNNTDFDQEVVPTFPMTFAWLLDVCAHLVETSKKMIFEEILLIEQIYWKHYKSLF